MLRPDTLLHIKAEFLNSQMGRVVARVVGKPESLRFRLARDTVGVMVIQAFSLGLGFVVSVVLALSLWVLLLG